MRAGGTQRSDAPRRAPRKPSLPRPQGWPRRCVGHVGAAPSRPPLDPKLPGPTPRPPHPHRRPHPRSLPHPARPDLLLCGAQADIINRGFSGYNSRWGTFLVDEVIAAYAAPGRLKFATVLFGANDAAGPDSSV